MAGKCFHHPGREAVIPLGGKGYCQQCKNGIDAAVRTVDRHVQPPSCFVTYLGGDRWRVITGTGCAHWVAHQKRLVSGGSGATCLLGNLVRVPDVITGKAKRSNLAKVKAGDIWVSPTLDHCGLVEKVAPDAKLGVRITIKHCSSKRGGVFSDDFHSHFGAKGSFYG